MSRYAVARWHALAFLIGMPAYCLIAGALLAETRPLLFFLGFFALAAAFAFSPGARCPDCRQSMFTRVYSEKRISSSFWPGRACARCGRDFTRN
ncbi:hypothetical protein P1X14_08045 [Sphingomonas sp. AOB5]|uniref:hypothetical protein n=1 Tax=Sphingomonas sp. AOB5 TaxID=3034017 RepID=UPI0023F77080|nr:hypothetical protein [Sphingomonas sp. AOB5]MDF7775194.1 hypothetical protein [Sphingomonas sp. AOB5]